MGLATCISDASRAACLAGLAAALAACSQSRPLAARPNSGAFLGNQGAAWELVLGAPQVPISGEWEYARLDDALNIRTQLEPGPYLDDLRRIYLIPRADQVLYFQRRGHYYRRDGW